MQRSSNPFQSVNLTEPKLVCVDVSVTVAVYVPAGTPVNVTLHCPPLPTVHVCVPFAIDGEIETWIVSPTLALTVNVTVFPLTWLGMMIIFVGVGLMVTSVLEFVSRHFMA
jgi:hypothetical protein